MAQLPYIVPAPQAQPPRYGLIAAAPTIDDANWRPGRFEFFPEQCGDGGRLSIDCPGGTDAIDVGANPGMVTGEPFVVWAGYECSPKGLSARDFQARARRQLAATESYELANELWTGALRDSDSMQNTALTDVTSDRVTSSAQTPVSALGCIEAGLASQLRGARGMIHIPPGLLAHYVSNFIVQWEQGVYVSPMRHLVVADAGYTGEGPGGDPVTNTQWIYGTSMIFVRLGPVEVLPPTDDYQQALDIRNNTARYVAERPVAYEWDLCGHVAAEVNIPPCDIGGAS